MSSSPPSASRPPWVDPWSNQTDQALTGDNMSLSKTVKGLQRQLGGSIQLAAKDNPVLGPQVQRLVTGYEAWENKLRSEAQSRLSNGFAPPDPGLHVRTLLSDGDWDLLKRVPKSLPSSSMKKSASADSLDSMAGTITTTGPTSSNRGGSRLGGGLGGRGHGPYGVDSHHDVGASYSSTSGYASGLHGEASMYGPRLVPMRGLQIAGAGAAGYQPSEQMLLRLGIPRVPTAPSLQEISDTLNSEAAKNIEAFLDTSLKVGTMKWLMLLPLMTS